MFLSGMSTGLLSTVAVRPPVDRAQLARSQVESTKAATYHAPPYTYASVPAPAGYGVSATRQLDRGGEPEYRAHHGHCHEGRRDHLHAPGLQGGPMRRGAAKAASASSSWCSPSASRPACWRPPAWRWSRASATRRPGATSSGRRSSCANALLLAQPGHAERRRRWPPSPRRRDDDWTDYSTGAATEPPLPVGRRSPAHTDCERRRLPLASSPRTSSRVASPRRRRATPSPTRSR